MKPSLKAWRQVSIFVYDKPSDAATPAATVLNLRPNPNQRMFYSDLSITGSVNRAGSAKFTVTNPGSATTTEKSLFSDDFCAVGVAPTEKYVVMVCGQDVIWSGKILRSVSATQSPFSTTQKFSQWEVECESDIGKMKLQEVNPPTPPTITGKVGAIVNAILKRKNSSDIDWTGFHTGSSPLLWESVISNEGGTLSYKILDTDMYTQFMSIVKLSGFEWKTRLANWVEDYVSWNPVTKVLGATNVFSRHTLAELTNKWVLFVGLAGDGSNIISYGQVSNTIPAGLVDFDGSVGNIDLSLRTYNWQAQSFIPTKANLVSIQVKMKKVGLPLTDLYFSICTDDGTTYRPSSTVLATATLSCSTLTTSFAYYTLSVPCNLTIGTRYWITMKCALNMVVGREAFFSLKAGNPYYRAYGQSNWNVSDNLYIYDFKTLYAPLQLKNVVNPTLLPAVPGTYRGCTFLNGGNYIYTGATYLPPVNSVVVFQAPVPPEITAGRNYCVVQSSTDSIRISDILGGTPLTFQKVTLYSNFAVATFSAGRCIILLNPVVDVAWDLEQITPVQTICANRSGNNIEPVCFSYNDNTDKKLVATKVIVKGKNIDTTESLTGRSDTISTALYANNKWEPEATMFENSTVVTQKMDGYIHDCVANDTVLHLYGQDYALQVGDVFDCWCKWSDNSTPEVLTSRTIDALSITYPQPDGTKTTSVSFTGGVLSTTKDCAKFSVFSARRVYVQDNARVYVNNASLWCGGSNSSGKPTFKTMSSMGSDPIYGKYIIGTTSYGGAASQVRPIFPGCYVSLNRGGENPRPGSPQALLGIISLTETVDQATTLGDLELYATQALINHSFYVRKGKFKCAINDFTKHGDRGYGQSYDWQLIKEGDRVAVNPMVTFPSGESLNDKYFDGQFKYKWEVIAWTLDCNTMTISAELGDYEHNMNTLLSDKTQSLDRTIS